MASQVGTQGGAGTPLAAQLLLSGRGTPATGPWRGAWDEAPEEPFSRKIFFKQSLFPQVSPVTAVSPT